MTPRKRHRDSGPRGTGGHHRRGVHTCGVHTRGGHTRGGLTLLELLLAISLCAFLMSATMTALHIAWKYRVEGDWAVEQAARLAGIRADLAADVRLTERITDGQDGPPGVRAAAWQALQQLVARDEAARDSTATPAGLRGSDFNEQFLNLDVAGRVAAVRFYGRHDFMAVLLSRPSYRFADAAHAAATHGLQRHAVWTATTDPLQIPFHQQNQRAVRTTLPARSSAGLVRWTRNFDPRTDRVPAATANVISPDVTSLTFEYFDGRSWQDHWDSSEQGRLPVAVRMHLTASDWPEQTWTVRVPLAEHGDRQPGGRS